MFLRARKNNCYRDLKRNKDIQTQTSWGCSDDKFGSKKHYLRDHLLRISPNSNLKKYAYGKCSKQSWQVNNQLSFENHNYQSEPT